MSDPHLLAIERDGLIVCAVCAVPCQGDGIGNWGWHCGKCGLIYEKKEGGYFADPGRPRVTLKKCEDDWHNCPIQISDCPSCDARPTSGRKEGPPLPCTHPWHESPRYQVSPCPACFEMSPPEATDLLCRKCHVQRHAVPGTPCPTCAKMAEVTRDCTHDGPDCTHITKECRHAWHEHHLVPIMVDACPSCDALPAISVKRNWEPDPTTRERIADHKVQGMMLNAKLHDVLMKLANGQLEGEFTKELIQLKSLELICVSGRRYPSGGASYQQWKLLDAGEAYVKKHRPRELIITTKDGRELRTGIDVPFGYRVEIADPKQGLVKLVPIKKGDSDCYGSITHRGLDENLRPEPKLDYMRLMIGKLETGEFEEVAVGFPPGYTLECVNTEEGLVRVVKKPEASTYTDMMAKAEQQTYSKPNPEQAAGRIDRRPKVTFTDKRFDEIADAIMGGAIDCESQELKDDAVWLVTTIQAARELMGMSLKALEAMQREGVMMRDVLPKLRKFLKGDHE